MTNEIDSDAAFKLMGQLAPTASANRPTDNSQTSEVQVMFCDLSDSAQLADFASRIRGARGLLDWSQGRLAREAGVNLRTLCSDLRERKESPQNRRFPACTRRSSPPASSLSETEGVASVSG